MLNLGSLHRKNNYRDMSKQLIQKTLSIFLGVMFVFSGMSKLFPIEAFETVTVQQGVMTWQLIPFFSRFLISFELLLGILFLFNIKLRKFTLPSSFILLVIFTIYLTILEITGNGGDNCGCFGELLPMTGVQSILKNIVFLGMIAYLFVSLETEKKFKLVHIAVGYVIVLALMVVIFPIKAYEVVTEPVLHTDKVKPHDEKILSPIEKVDSLPLVKHQDSVKSVNTPKKKEEKKPALSSKYPPVVSIYSQFFAGADKGIMLIAFFSLDCDHCLAVATALNQNASSLTKAGRYYLFLGSEDQVTPFFASSGGSVSNTILSPQKFYPNLNSAPPKVILLANGNVVMTMEGEGVNTKMLIDKINELTLTYLL